MVTINKSKEIEEKLNQFKDQAPVKTAQEPAAEPVEHVVEEEHAKPSKSAPWREGVNMDEEALLNLEKRLNCMLNMELHLRLEWIKARKNMEALGSRKGKVSIADLVEEAIDEYTSKIIKKMTK